MKQEHIFLKGGKMLIVKKSLYLFSIVLFTLSLLWCGSCTHRVVNEEEEEIAGREGKAETTGLEGEEITEEELEESRRKVEELRKKGGVKLSNIYFPLDDFSLSKQAKKALIENAAWLMNNVQRKVMSEGHCDERGTEEYNIALGERRAKSAKRYLINLGVKHSQLSTISYGEEKPAEPGHNEEAWAQNRRVHFVIQ
jgi:peptidoglycan-associated lipoprotein